LLSSIQAFVLALDLAFVYGTFSLIIQVLLLMVQRRKVKYPQFGRDAQ